MTRSDTAITDRLLNLISPLFPHYTISLLFLFEAPEATSILRIDATRLPPTELRSEGLSIRLD